MKNYIYISTLVVSIMLIFFVVICEATMEISNKLFQEGNQAYSQENYEEAITLYNQILANSQSAELHFNLANAYFKNDDMGRAILHFEKSLVLDPGNPDYIANLNFVRKSVQLDIKNGNIFSTLSSRLTLNQWCLIAIVCFWLVVFLMTIPRLYQFRNAVIQTALSFSILILVTSLLSIYGYFLEFNKAVIISNEASLKVSPTESSGSSDNLREGEVVTVEDSHQNYYYVSSNDGKEGWVINVHLGKIWDGF